MCTRRAVWAATGPRGGGGRQVLAAHPPSFQGGDGPRHRAGTLSTSSHPVSLPRSLRSSWPSGRISSMKRWQPRSRAPARPSAPTSQQPAPCLISVLARLRPPASQLCSSGAQPVPTDQPGMLPLFPQPIGPRAFSLPLCITRPLALLLSSLLPFFAACQLVLLHIAMYCVGLACRPMRK